MLFPFRNEFDKFNNTRARMLDFIIYKVMKYRKILIKYDAYLKISCISQL